jgi:hypothetical protein
VCSDNVTLSNELRLLPDTSGLLGDRIDVFLDLRRWKVVKMFLFPKHVRTDENNNLAEVLKGLQSTQPPC